MNCGELEVLLCDYVDGTLGAEERAIVEQHLSACPACSELVRDSSAALAFMERAADVEPPPELITHILFQNRPERSAIPLRKGWRGWIGRWLEPVLQPRFAMGMAMTILSFSMLGQFAGIPLRQLRPSDLHPAKVWAALEDRVHQTWESVVKYYDSLRLVYEIQSRLREWTEQEEEQRRSQPQSGQALERNGNPARTVDELGDSPTPRGTTGAPGVAGEELQQVRGKQ